MRPAISSVVRVAGCGWALSSRQLGEEQNNDNSVRSTIPTVRLASTGPLDTVLMLSNHA